MNLNSVLRLCSYGSLAGTHRGSSCPKNTPYPARAARFPLSEQAPSVHTSSSAAIFLGPHIGLDKLRRTNAGCESVWLRPERAMCDSYLRVRAGAMAGLLDMGRAVPIFALEEPMRLPRCVEELV